MLVTVRYAVPVDACVIECVNGFVSSRSPIVDGSLVCRSGQIGSGDEVDVAASVVEAIAVADVATGAVLVIAEIGVVDFASRSLDEQATQRRPIADRTVSERTTLGRP